MARAKRASKQKRRRTALPAWGAAGMSLAMAGGASAAVAPTANTPSQQAASSPAFFLGEEEISDVSLATFYVFDRESANLGERLQLAARGCGGCRGCRGCAARGCAGCAARGCAVGVRGCRGCRGCGVGFRGCGGCGCGCVGSCWLWTPAGWVAV